MCANYCLHNCLANKSQAIKKEIWSVINKKRNALSIFEFLKDFHQYGLIFRDRKVQCFLFCILILEVILMAVVLYLKKKRTKSLNIKQSLLAEVILWILIGIIFLLICAVVFSFPIVQLLIL